MGGVDRFEDLNCWKLASALCDEVYRITESGRVRRDFLFRNQIRDSAASAPRNIAEGWGRYYPKQNAPYVRIANGSLEETINHLFHGKRQKYFSPKDFNRAYRLADRALRATTRYLLYLEGCEKDPPRDRGAKPSNLKIDIGDAASESSPLQESPNLLAHPGPAPQETQPLDSVRLSIPDPADPGLPDSRLPASRIPDSRIPDSRIPRTQNPEPRTPRTQNLNREP